MTYITDEETNKELVKMGKVKKEQNGAICGDGMCPYVPCKDYPKCRHIEGILKE